MYLDLLTGNGLIPQCTYYDFNDSILIVIILVWKQHIWFNTVCHKPFNGKLNLIHSDILSVCI